MKLEILDTYDAISKRAASLIKVSVEADPSLLFCAATGNSPSGAYALLRGLHQHDRALFCKMRVLKLDEWGGLPMEDPRTCETYLQQHLVQPLQIDPPRYLSFQSDPADPAEECIKMQETIRKAGPIGLCVLGIGVNGHMALNEPADQLQPYMHVNALAESTLAHPMVSNGPLPSYGLTLGVSEIMRSKMILLLISGSSKRAITARLLEGRITTQLPSSLLWLHPNTVCLIDRAAYGIDSSASEN
jgi:galactosamine-6-phosphate isomerase